LAPSGYLRKKWAAVEAPSSLGLRAGGVEGLPAALEGAGLLDTLDSGVVTKLHVPRKTGVKDASTEILHSPEVAQFARLQADAVGYLLDAGRIPLVLGGDCSILLGNALALGRRGRFGLLFLDGHADFYQPSAEPTGEAASMDLALVTGHGPQLLEASDPPIRAEDVVVFGFRDGEESARNGSQPLPLQMVAFDLATVRSRGVDRIVEDALAHLARADGPERFWIHVDADVLDDEVMPAVDYRLPGGLTTKELVTVLRVATATGRVAGIEVTIYNPTLDPGGKAGRALATALADGLH
jgi:arginase